MGSHDKWRAAGNASWSDQCSGRAKLHYTRRLTLKQGGRKHASARAKHWFHSARRLIVKSTREACKIKMPFCRCCFSLWPSDFSLRLVENAASRVHGAKQKKKEKKNKTDVYRAGAVFSCTLELADISLTPKFPSSFPESAPVGGQHIKLT